MTTAQVPVYHMSKGVVGDRKRIRLVISAPSAKTQSNQGQCTEGKNVNRHRKKIARNRCVLPETSMGEGRVSGNANLTESTTQVINNERKQTRHGYASHLTGNYVTQENTTSYHWSSAKSATEMAVRNKRKKYDPVCNHKKQSEHRVLNWAKELNLVDREEEGEVTSSKNDKSLAFCDIVQILDRAVSNLSTDGTPPSSAYYGPGRSGKGGTRFPLVLKRYKTDISRVRNNQDNKDLDLFQKGVSLMSRETTKGAFRLNFLGKGCGEMTRSLPDPALLGYRGRPPSSRLATRGSPKPQSPCSGLSDFEEEPEAEDSTTDNEENIPISSSENYGSTLSDVILSDEDKICCATHPNNGETISERSNSQGTGIDRSQGNVEAHTLNMKNKEKSLGKQTLDNITATGTSVKGTGINSSKAELTSKSIQYKDNRSKKEKKEIKKDEVGRNKHSERVDEKKIAGNDEMCKRSNSEGEELENTCKDSDAELEDKTEEADIPLRLRLRVSAALQQGTSSFNPINVKYRTQPNTSRLKRQNTMFDQGAYVEFQHSKFNKELANVSVTSRTVQANDIKEFIKVGVGGETKKVPKT